MSYLIAALTATVLLLILAIQNPGPVEVRFLFWHGSMPLVLLLLITTVLGGALTVAAAMPQRLRLLRRLREAENEVGASPEHMRPLQTGPAPETSARTDAVAGLAEAAQGIKETES